MKRRGRSLGASSASGWLARRRSRRTAQIVSDQVRAQVQLATSEEPPSQLYGQLITLA